MAMTPPSLDGKFHHVFTFFNLKPSLRYHFLTDLYYLQFDYIVDTNKQTIHEVHEGKPKLTKKRINYLLSQLRRGTEQLLFSFLLPSTLSTTSNIVDLQKLVTTGNLFLNKFYLDNLDIKDA